jgi:glycosyltransferase involved in cell wall biosynthesis
MIRIFVNGLAASAGGGLTYLRNVIPRLACRADVDTHVLVGSSLRNEFGELPGVSFLESQGSSRMPARFFYEQIVLPPLIEKTGSQVLVSAGNFAVWKASIPQILLSRNSLYTSKEFYRDVRARGNYAILADTAVKGYFARRSIRRAELTLSPSEAFASELSQWTGVEVATLHHGFDAAAFTSNPTPLPEEIQRQLDAGKNGLRLLFVSHYNYYRNFETLFRALPILKERLRGHGVKLYLTCRLTGSENHGAYDAASAASLANRLRLHGEIIELGNIPYHSLHHLYQACDLYVTPAYAESFAHPLVESMSAGLPVVASDLPVHREICRNAAVYFPCFSAETLAESVLHVYENSETAAALSNAGRIRAQDFSWDAHVEKLLELALGLVSQCSSNKRVPLEYR